MAAMLSARRVVGFTVFVVVVVGVGMGVETVASLAVSEIAQEVGVAEMLEEVSATPAEGSRDKESERLHHHLWVDERRLLVRCKRGTFMLYDTDSVVSAVLSTYGEWCDTESDLLAVLVHPGELVVDGGAHIGTFAVAAARVVGPAGYVFAFEPQWDMFEALETNLRLNNDHRTSNNNVGTFRMALGQNSGETHIRDYSDETRDLNFASFSLLTEIPEGAPVTALQVISIDDFFAEHAAHALSAHIEHDKVAAADLVRASWGTRLDGERVLLCPSLVKLDIEGYEVLAIRGAAEIIARCKPLLYVENNCVKTSESVIRAVHELGYHVFWDTHFLVGEDSNFFGSTDPRFQLTVSINMIAAHPDRPDLYQRVQGLMNGTTPVGPFSPVRIDVDSEQFLSTEYRFQYRKSGQYVRVQQGGNLTYCAWMDQLGEAKM